MPSGCSASASRARCLRRHDGEPAAALGEQAQDVVLDAVVVGDDVEPRLALRRDSRCPAPSVLAVQSYGASHVTTLARSSPAIDGAARARAIARQRRPPRSALAGRDDAAVLRAVLAQDARELARVDVGDAEDVRLAQVFATGPGACASSTTPRQVADHEARGEHASRFGVLGVDADVADVRIGQRHDLARIRRIGEDFLVAGHRRVEHDFAARMADRADRATAKQRAVGEREQRLGLRRHERSAGGERGERGGRSRLFQLAPICRDDMPPIGVYVEPNAEHVGHAE